LHTWWTDSGLRATWQYGQYISKEYKIPFVSIKYYLKCFNVVCVVVFVDFIISNGNGNSCAPKMVEAVVY